MSALKLIVVGAGHLGRIHARLLASLPDTELVAIVDPDDDARRRTAAETDVPVLPDWRSVPNYFDAAIVAVPSTLHHPVGLELIAAGKHVLMEKPLATGLRQAEELVLAADEQDVVLQVGHVERFNPAFLAAAPLLPGPRFIEAVREGPYTGRSTDIGVVLDLMIHDLDLVLNLVNAPLVDVQAVGTVVVGPHEDLAHARLQFADGAVATFACSRVSRRPARRMRVFTTSSMIEIDFASREARRCSPSNELIASRFAARGSLPASFRENLMERHLPEISLPVVEHNALLEEQRDFLHAVRTGDRPVVDGHQGRVALQAAEQVLESIARHSRQSRRYALVQRRQAA